jgi:hypothetical protein
MDIDGWTPASPAVAGCNIDVHARRSLLLLSASRGMPSSMVLLLEPFRSVAPTVDHAMLRIYIEVRARAVTQNKSAATRTFLNHKYCLEGGGPSTFAFAFVCHLFCAPHVLARDQMCVA